MTYPSLLTALNCAGHVHLVVGSGPLAAARVSKSLEAGARPTFIAPSSSDVHYTLAKRFKDGQVSWTRSDFTDADLTALGRPEVDHVVDAVFVTIDSKSSKSAHISSLCQRLRIPVNVVDAPELCSFTLLSTHSDGPLQIGITTSGQGCKLSSRIRREIAAALPPNFGHAVSRLGALRRRIWEEDCEAGTMIDTTPEMEDGDSPNQKHNFNALIHPEDASSCTARNRRLRWLSQICEYWPLSRLANITDSDISAISTAYTDLTNNETPLTSGSVDFRSSPPRGIITLAGSGPGHPDLLTRATHDAIQNASFILADKLVPAPVLELIPRRTPVHIARKFPGNADAAQEELLSLGLDALKKGQHVLRLKQGDPYLYGRGAEEVDFFRRHGYVPQVLPGVTSALSAPLFAGIPVTHRAVADQVLICTGTGRRGAAPDPPSYHKSLTVVFLMALHRLESLVASLTTAAESEDLPKNDLPNHLSSTDLSISPPSSSSPPQTRKSLQQEHPIQHEYPPNPHADPLSHFLPVQKEPSIVAFTQKPNGNNQNHHQQPHNHPLSSHHQTTPQTTQPLQSSQSIQPMSFISWPSTTPCAIIERASCPDQRVIRTTLQHAVQAVHEEGSRPPGLLVLGRVCEVLNSRRIFEEKRCDGVDDGDYKERNGDRDAVMAEPGATGDVEGWKSGKRWIVEEGFRELDRARDWGSILEVENGLQGGKINEVEA